jgi:hypothetical protein
MGRGCVAILHVGWSFVDTITMLSRRSVPPHQRFLLELVRFPGRLHRQLYSNRDRGLHSYWSYCRAITAKAQSGCLKLVT